MLDNVAVVSLFAFFWFTMTFIQGPPSGDEVDKDPCKSTGAPNAVCDMSLCI